MNLAFVLLTDVRLPGEKDVVKAFGSYARGRERLEPSKDEQPSSAEKALAFELTPGGMVVVALMPVAVPNGEADQGARFSVSALGTGWKLPAHKAHLVVALPHTDPAPAAEVLSAFTSLLAAVAATANAVGVYWGEAGATHDARFFTGIAKERDTGQRIMLWTGLSMGAEPDGRLSLLSLGMKQLSLPDLLLVARQSEANAALGTFFDLLGYVTSLGQSLPEGDTVGRSATEHLPVRYVPSPIDPSIKVWRVELP